MFYFSLARLSRFDGIALARVLAPVYVPLFQRQPEQDLKHEHTTLGGFLKQIQFYLGIKVSILIIAPRAR